MQNIMRMRSYLSSTIKDTSTIICNQLPEYVCGEDCAGIIAETSCSHYLSHGASLQHHSSSE